MNSTYLCCKGPRRPGGAQASGSPSPHRTGPTYAAKGPGVREGPRRPGTSGFLASPTRIGYGCTTGGPRRPGRPPPIELDLLILQRAQASGRGPGVRVVLTPSNWTYLYCKGPRCPGGTQASGHLWLLGFSHPNWIRLYDRGAQASGSPSPHRTGPTYTAKGPGVRVVLTPSNSTYLCCKGPRRPGGTQASGHLWLLGFSHPNWIRLYDWGGPGVRVALPPSNWTYLYCKGPRRPGGAQASGHLWLLPPKLDTTVQPGGPGVRVALTPSNSTYLCCKGPRRPGGAQASGHLWLLPPELDTAV
ncbi:uncharacterized protein [Struthio camelus]|uniref:uncharacterized protein n=1 Tax=Struthio camelus TaxID=8801 RepID=UPI003603B1A0